MDIVGLCWVTQAVRLGIVKVGCLKFPKHNQTLQCVEEDSGMRYLVGLDEECNMTVVDAVKDFLVHAWNKRQGC
ncbi:hypothetical protein FHG87_023388 [Trinorchestia longiramus]|nr:hypothetical protein FHG87_023388 [Trinorchestia longiramus]